MAVTQKQVAQHVGVSSVWVSLALSNHPSVPLPTRQRIQAAAKELGYGAGSNRGARFMAAKRHGRVLKTNSFAIVFPAPSDPDEGMKKNDPYFLPLFEAIELAARDRGIEIILCPVRPGVLPSIVSATELDGVVDLFISSQHKKMLARLGMPAVALNHRPDDQHSVEPDDRAGTRLAVEHLAALGHKRIAYLGQPATFHTGYERFKGYLDGLAICGLSYDQQREELSAVAFSMNYGVMAAERLLGRNADFTGLVCYNDSLAMDAIKVIQGRGLTVPGDISVTGFDDISLAYEFDPSLTSIRFSSVEIGARAVEMLIDLIQNPAEAPDHNHHGSSHGAIGPRRVNVPVELVVRASTARLQS